MVPEPGQLEAARTGRQRGEAAEALAGRHLRAAGLSVLERGFTRRVGEIDLIAIHPPSGTVIFVEVRFRTSLHRGGPIGSVDARKRARLLRAVRAWLAARQVDERRPIRIDVIGVTLATATTGLDGWLPVEGYALRWVRNAVRAE